MWSPWIMKSLLPIDSFHINNYDPINVICRKGVCLSGPKKDMLTKLPCTTLQTFAYANLAEIWVWINDGKTSTTLMRRERTRRFCHAARTNKLSKLRICRPLQFHFWPARHRRSPESATLVSRLFSFIQWDNNLIKFRFATIYTEYCHRALPPKARLISCVFLRNFSSHALFLYGILRRLCGGHCTDKFITAKYTMRIPIRITCSAQKFDCLWVRRPFRLLFFSNLFLFASKLWWPSHEFALRSVDIRWTPLMCCEPFSIHQKLR